MNFGTVITVVSASLLFFPACRKPEPVAQTAEVAVSPAAAPAVSDTAASAAPASTAPPPASPAAGVIATADGEQSGVRAEITELKRSSGGTINLKVTFVNDSSEMLNFGYDFVEKDKGYGDIGGIHLLDPVGKKKYFVARDSEGNCVCSKGLKDQPKGERRSLWAKFPAPPPDVKKISVVIPHFSPLDDVPIAE